MWKTGALALSIGLLSALAGCGSAPSMTTDLAAGPVGEGPPAHPSPDVPCPAVPGLARQVSTGGEPESLSGGACLVHAALMGNAKAARILGDAYAGALATRGSRAGLPADLFGRQIQWYRAAARSGQSVDEIRLARALDFDPRVTMPDPALAYYTRAASHGDQGAADTIAQAWAKGRIYAARIVDFRLWVEEQAPSHPALAKAAILLEAEPQGGI
jgi:hypothetical protein